MEKFTVRKMRRSKKNFLTFVFTTIKEKRKKTKDVFDSLSVGPYFFLFPSSFHLTTDC